MRGSGSHFVPWSRIQSKPWPRGSLEQLQKCCRHLDPLRDAAQLSTSAISTREPCSSADHFPRRSCISYKSAMLAVVSLHGRMKVESVPRKTIVTSTASHQPRLRQGAAAIEELLGTAEGCKSSTSHFGSTVESQEELRGSFVPYTSQCQENNSIKGNPQYAALRCSAPKDAAWFHLSEYCKLQPVQTAGACASYQPGFDKGAECLKSGSVTVRVEDLGVECASDLQERELFSADSQGFDLLLQWGSYIPSSLLYQALRRCIAKKDLITGQMVHGVIVKNGYKSDRFLGNHVIRMYGAHGKLQEALLVFSTLHAPNAHSWSCIILAHAEHGHAVQAIELYWQMRQSTVMPDNHTFVAVLKACVCAADLAAGRQVHADLLSAAVEPDVYVGNCLVDMYAKCGSLQDARRIFDHLSVKDVVSWTAMLGGYTFHGLGQEALSLYAYMQHEGITVVDHVTLVCLLKACSATGALDQGLQLHAQVRGKRLEDDVVVGSSLVDMYAKCGRLDDARRVFDKLMSRNVVTWTAMLAGYAEHGLGEEALDLYASMQQEGITLADQVSIVCLLKACASSGALDIGRQLHIQVQERGLEADVVIGNCLVDMYAKCGSLDDAKSVFDNLAQRDVVTWTGMLSGYAEQGFGQEALTLYARMRQDGITPDDHVAFACLLKACASVGALDQGKQIHVELQKRGLEGHVIVGNCLVDMYAKCGSLDDARMVFDGLPTKTVASWTAMLSGYADHGLGQDALALYAAMQKEGNISADQVTFICLLKLCASIGALDQGMEIHSRVQENGLEADVVVGSCLVDMYAKCGSLADARRVFEALPERNVVTWTSMITAYSQDGFGHEALALYGRMIREGITADHVALTSLFKACANTGALHQGKQLHIQVQGEGLESDMVFGSCLVDMYAKCGSLDDACVVFNKLVTKNVVTWNAMLGAFSQHGRGHEALQCYEDMQLSGISPDEVTFLSLLSACSHAGLVDKGMEYFESMTKGYGISPKIEHYVSMIDLFGRAGRFARVEEMLSTMPMQPDVAVWLSVLAACRTHTNLALAQVAFARAVHLQPKHPASYLLMSQIYASAGLLDRAQQVQFLRKREGAWKEPGHSWFAHEGRVHCFFVGKSHLQSIELHDIIEEVSKQATEVAE